MTPDKFTIKELFVPVGDGHEIYVQEWGNPKAKVPILRLHGGPGSSTSDKARYQFNPYEHRVIFYDQRGCGRSIPFGSLKHNTTNDLVEDIEKILDYLKVDQCIITGASWGSCLALAYGIKYQERIKSMVLQGIFTGSKAEIQYLDSGGFRSFFPDVWDHYLSNTPKNHHSDPSGYHFARILGQDPEAKRASAYIYANLEGSLIKLDDRFIPEDPKTFDPTETAIEVYYLFNNCFMPERYILNNAHKLNVPIWLVQGRYDFVCPPQTAYELHQLLPDSTLIWTMAGHANDRSNYDVNRTIFASL
ncbi:MAG TPA: alpha/beta fold hydrolase [Candidatus Saccharimonadales bacterium]|jgi:proline iminopeptidase|nr:alpha/beta fold hydrolase [Candidatus Saccharimonadales bacterium]